MTPESIWHRKSDHELIAASERLHEYTNIGQQKIAAELERRGLPVDRERFAAARVADEPEPDLAAPSPVPAPTDSGGQLQSARALLTRLWRGEVRLATTYWGWGFCGNLALVLVLLLIEKSGSTAAIAAWSVVAAPYSVFIMVAIWRSAGRYQGFALWGYMARLAIVVSVIRAVGMLIIGGAA